MHFNASVTFLSLVLKNLKSITKGDFAVSHILYNYDISAKNIQRHHRRLLACPVLIVIAAMRLAAGWLPRHLLKGKLNLAIDYNFSIARKILPIAHQNFLCTDRCSYLLRSSSILHHADITPLHYSVEPNKNLIIRKSVHNCQCIWKNLIN